MQTIWADEALTQDGWRRGVLVTIGGDGRIASVKSGQPAQGRQTAVLLPAPANAHSHAFQRAMSGLTEGPSPDARGSFWTWRELMYRFLERLTPEHIEHITAFAQMEMLEAGFASCVEFHYIHHGPGGAPYARLSEMSARIAAAAAESQIGLTLAPVHYQFGGCDRRALQGGQLRFGNSPDRFAALLAECRSMTSETPADTRIGVAAHSLRAVAPDSVRDLPSLVPGGPYHIHLAEQQAEVEEVTAAFGKRPAEWMLDNAALDSSWCLIHCTQMQPHETAALARTGAVAGLCPITEADLGDGVFDGVRWLDAGGRIAVGSDSNVKISLAEELGMLEYSQRLQEHARAVLAAPGQSAARRLFEMSAAGGAYAAGRPCGALAPGNWADLLALNGAAVDLAGRRGDKILDSFVFGRSRDMVSDVWSAGRHIVQDGEHISRSRIQARYRSALQNLVGAL